MEEPLEKNYQYFCNATYVFEIVLSKEIVEKSDVIVTLSVQSNKWLNPRTGAAGVVDFNPPVRFFADSEKTAARSAAKFAIAVQPTI